MHRITCCCRGSNSCKSLYFLIVAIGSGHLGYEKGGANHYELSRDVTRVSALAFLCHAFEGLPSRKLTYV